MVSLLEGTTWVRGLYRIVNEVVTLVEVLVRTITPTGPAALVSIINETVNLLANHKRVMDMVRFSNETVTISAVHKKVLALVRLANETVTIISTGRLIRGFSRVVNETVTISETIVRTITEAAAGMITWATLTIEPKISWLKEEIKAKISGKIEDENGRKSDI